eukprot:scaffold162_cov275-Pinguiococcus_pyrenoidosus.AAC.14
MPKEAKACGKSSAAFPAVPTTASFSIPWRMSCTAYILRCSFMRTSGSSRGSSSTTRRIACPKVAAKASQLPVAPFTA